MSVDSTIRASFDPLFRKKSVNKVRPIRILVANSSQPINQFSSQIHNQAISGVVIILNSV
jgi:hypothetical protein